MQVFLAIGAAHALYLIILLLAKQPRHGHDWVLMAYLAVFGLMLGTAYAASAYGMEALWLLHLNNALLLAPLCFLYIDRITRPHPPPWTRWTLHLIPFGLTTLYWLFLIATQPEAQLEQWFASDTPVGLPVLFTLALVLDALAIPAYTVWALWRLHRHRERIAQSFSFREGIDLRWARILVVCTGLFWVGMVAAEGLGAGWTLNPSIEDAERGYVFATFFLFVLGYFGVRQGVVFAASMSAPPTQATAPYERSGLKPAEQAVHAEALKAYLADAQPYLKSRLTISDLAEALEVSPHHLSQVINAELQTTFYDLINTHRVEAFKRRAAAPDAAYLTVLALALESGFNSKASFYRVFKKIEGCTPTAYLHQVRSHETEADKTSHRPG